MTNSEVYHIVSEYVKFRTGEPPYQMEPEGDVWKPTKPRYTVEETTAAIKKLLEIAAPRCAP
jgi:hypothetical protein